MINDLKSAAASEEVKNENINQKMLGVSKTLNTDHESFIELFVEQRGIYNLQSCLKNPSATIKAYVFDIVPRLFSFDSAPNFIKGKLDFFTSLYQFMDDDSPKLRELATAMFVKII